MGGLRDAGIAPRLLVFAFLLAAVAEGTAGVVVYAYGPVYMRQGLGEPRLAVVTSALALASLATFFLAGRWGRWGDRTGRPGRLVALGLLGAALGLAISPAAPSSVVFGALLVAVTASLAGVIPLSVAWLTLRQPDRPGEAAARLYRARSLGWAAGSFGSGWLADTLELAGVRAAFYLCAAIALVAAAVVARATRASRPGFALAAGGAGDAVKGVKGTPTAAHAGEPAGRTQPDGRSRAPATAGTATGAAQSKGTPQGMEMRGSPSPQRTDATSSATPGTGAEPVANRRAAAATPVPLPAPAGPGATAGLPIWRYPEVVALAAAVLLTASGNEAFFAVFSAYLTEFLGGSNGQVGWALGLASTLGILIMAPVGRLADRWGPRRVFTLGIAGYVAMYALICAFRTPAATVAAFALPLYPLTATGATGVISRTLPPARRAEAVGLYEGSAALAASLGSAAGGLVADAAGLARVPMVSLGLAVAGALVAWRWVAGRSRG